MSLFARKPSRSNRRNDLGNPFRSDDFPKIPGFIKAWFLLIAVIALGTFGGAAFVVYKLLKFYGVL